MSYWENDYKPEPYIAKEVPAEGIYYCKVNEVTYGNKDGKRWTKIDLIIKSDGRPHVSLFLTEGENFNQQCTAFWDTFGITRGEKETKNWIGKYGYMNIKFRFKDGYKNMVPYYIYDENGWVKKPTASHSQPQNAQPPVQQAPQQYQDYDNLSPDDDIQF